MYIDGLYIALPIFLIVTLSIHIIYWFSFIIYNFKHSCRMLGDRNLPFCTYWAHARCLGCPGVCQSVYTGHRQQYSLLILSIYNFDIL